MMLHPLHLLKLFVPPIIPVLMNKFTPALADRLRPAERTYIGTTWPGDARSPGWDDASTPEVLRENWPLVFDRIASTGELTMIPYQAGGRDLSAHNMLMTFLYVLARASRGSDRLTILDWGGMLGHYALVAQRMLPEVSLDYLVKDLPPNCRLGRELNPTIAFCESDEECFARRYCVVVANGSVQYVKDWRALVARLAGSSTAWLLINCLPIVYSVPSFVVVQRLRSIGFKGDFYSNVFNHDDFVEEVKRHGFVLERELMSWDRVRYRGAPEHPVGAGFLFCRR